MAGEEERERELHRVVEQLAAWAKDHSEISALAMVGSRARGTARLDSDLDVVILTATPERFTESDDWLAVLNHPPIISQRQFGVITERRVRLQSGLEIEFGIGSPDWAATHPVDPGTARVTRDGLRILHDSDGLLAELQAAVRRDAGGGADPLLGDNGS